VLYEYDQQFQQADLVVVLDSGCDGPFLHA